MDGVLKPERSLQPQEQSVRKSFVTELGSFARSMSMTCLLLPFTHRSFNIIALALPQDVADTTGMDTRKVRAIRMVEFILRVLCGLFENIGQTSRTRAGTTALFKEARPCVDGDDFCYCRLEGCTQVLRRPSIVQVHASDCRRVAHDPQEMCMEHEQSLRHLGALQG